MNDSRTTELLRKGLTEHGIEWKSGFDGVTFVGDWCFVEYDNGRLAATCESVLTPEQAIAATLGGGECEVALARLVDVAAKVDVDSCVEILECVDAIRKAVKR